MMTNIPNRVGAGAGGGSLLNRAIALLAPGTILTVSIVPCFYCTENYGAVVTVLSITTIQNRVTLFLLQVG